MAEGFDLKGSVSHTEWADEGVVWWYRGGNVGTLVMEPGAALLTLDHITLLFVFKANTSGCVI